MHSLCDPPVEFSCKTEASQLRILRVTCDGFETRNFGMVCYATVDKEYPFEIGASLSVAPQK